MQVDQCQFFLRLDLVKVSIQLSWLRALAILPILDHSEEDVLVDAHQAPLGDASELRDVVIV